MTTQPRVLRLQPNDSVVVAVDVVDQGKKAEGVTALARIPRGHKMATRLHAKGEPIVKYGQIIGFANEDIPPGSWIHTHNCNFAAFDRDYAFALDSKPEDLLPLSQRATFQGYRRATGRAGTRNYIAIMTSVNCSASVARFMAEEVRRSNLLADYPHVDGVIPLVHGTGCGMADKGEGFDALQRTTWGYATNPNVAAVLLVGLGCEMFQIERFKKQYGIVEGDTFQTMTIQEMGGTRKTIEAGVAKIREMLPRVNAARRETFRRQNSVWRCNVVARMAIPASQPMRPLGSRLIFSSSMVAQPFSRKRRRSMAPNIC